MRHLFIVVILTLLLIAPIEAQAEETSDVPNQDIIYLFKTPFGVLPVLIPKGTFNPKWESIHWFSPEDWQKREKAEEKRLEEERKFHEEYIKKYPELFGPKQRT